jgi:oligoribonuclease
MLLWLDMETTGLNFEQDIPLEVGIILMEENGMVEIARKSWLCTCINFIWEPNNEFVHKMHTDNGLLEEMHAHPFVYGSYYEIDNEICEWILHDALKDHPGYQLHPAGSSVHFDVRFAERRFPKFYSLLHHRHFDVSSIKMLSMLNGNEYDKGPDDPHRALADLDNDINWLKNNWRA